jgi:predicted permease
MAGPAKPPHTTIGGTMLLRLALRRLASTPTFTAGAVALLALGTGATFAVFTVLDALVLKTLPVRDPGQLVAIEVQNARGEPSALPRHLFDALTERQHSLDQVTGVLGGSVVSANAGGTVHQSVVDGVTADYFALLELSIVTGRALGPADYRAVGSDADPVVVISEGYASRMFGAPGSALGRTITLGETTVTVVGVSAEAFPGLQVGVRTDVVVPAPVVGGIIGLPPSSVPFRYAFGRLAPDRTIEDVRAEWSGIWQSEMSLAAPERRPADAVERRLLVTSGATGASGWRSRYQGPLQLTAIASAWLLVIACANLAGLQFGRVIRREQEVAVSRALGASEWGVMAPTVLEALLIGACGLLLGAPLAAGGARLATDLLSTGSVPLTLDLTPDWSAWVVLAAVAVLVTMGAGVVPAWLAIGRTGGLVSTSRVVSGQGRMGSVLVAGQIALAVVLLTGAAFAVDALVRVAWREHGFEPDRILAAQLVNRPGGYTNLDDEVYYRTLLDRLAATPGVSAVALTKPLPAGLSAPPIQEPVSISGRTSGVTDAGVVMGSPGYFDVLGLSVLAGRPFDWRDDAGAPAVALISQALARHLMPDGFRAGLRIDVGRLPHHRGLEVVGLVGDASTLNVRDAAPRVVYLSSLQQPPPMARWPVVVVRTKAGARLVAPILARTVDELGREFVVRSDTLAAHITRSLARERLLAGMAVMYGSLAIAMVAIGLWALLAQDVTRRLREFGVRLSLGASPTTLYRSVAARAVQLTACGLVIGAALTWMLVRQAATAGLDRETSSWPLAGAMGLLLVVAVCAATGPARRAARTEPMAALRSE